jgi:hypothetical protein
MTEPTSPAEPPSKRRPTRISKKELAAYRRAYDITTAFGQITPVTIEGVTLHLYCDLDTQVWRPVNHLGLYGPWALHGPEIIFPWTPPGWRKALRKQGEVIEALPGSEVHIFRIEDAEFKGLIDATDGVGRQRKMASVMVIAPDKSLHVARRRLVLIHETATTAHIELGEYGKAYRSLLTKLGNLSGIDDLEGASFEGEPESWPPAREDLAPGYRWALQAFVRAQRHNDEDALVAFGYLMARAELHDQLQPMVEVAQQAKASRQKATESRQAEGQRVKALLQGIAREVIALEPNISLTKCAKKVLDIGPTRPGWKKYTSGVDWVSGHIKVLFERRPGRKEYRPIQVPPS